MLTTEVIARTFVRKLAERLGRHTAKGCPEPVWTEPLEYSWCDQFDAVVSFDQDDMMLLLVDALHKRLLPVVDTFAQKIPHDAKFVVLPIPQGSVGHSRMNLYGISARVLPVRDLHTHITSYTISVAISKTED